MNDFTINELNILYKCVRIAEMEYGESNDLDLVKARILLLLDNYPTHCEHSGVEIDEICTKCHKNKCASFGRLCEDCYRDFEEWINK